MKLITSIIATISLLSLAIYDFLCICRIIGKEELVEKIWKRILPNKPYDEKRVFVLIRPMLLHVWFMTLILSGGVLSNIPGYNLMNILSLPLAAGVAIKNIREN